MYGAGAASVPTLERRLPGRLHQGPAINARSPHLFQTDQYEPNVQ